MTLTTQLPIQNVSCDACEKVIGRLLKRYPNARVESVSKDARTLTLSCEENDLPGIKARLAEYNYLDASMRVPHHAYILRRIIQNHPGFRAENKLLTQAILLFAILFVGIGGAYLVFGPNTSFMKLLPILLLLPIGIATNTGALVHVRQLSQHFNCSNGMMAGMIIGMIAGFMSGAIIGATNGMFIGSIIGMGVGMGASAYAVRRMGIMSILEGLMAGLMAGTMGAMLSVMMIADNLIPFLYILFFVCIVILAGMSYFMIKEIGPIHDEERNMELIPMAAIGLLVLVAFVWLALFGPKSIIAFGVVA